VSVQSLSVSPSETEDIHVHFIKAVAPTPRPESSELQKLGRNVEAAQAVSEKSL